MLNIPKELHLYWDNSNMSELQTFTVTSFHKQNPDWKINLYTPKQCYSGSARYIPDYLGDDYFHTIKNLPYVNLVEIDLDDYGIDSVHHNILRSDIFRYHILYNVGGVWSDFDVLWLKPISHFTNLEYHGDVLPDDINTVVSFINGTNNGHSIGIMIHCKNDQYIKSLIELVKKIKPPFTHEAFGGGMLNTYYPDLDSMSKFEGVVGAKFKTYYPYNIHPPYNTIGLLYHSNNLNPIDDEVLCLHWYNGHILSKEYINNNGFMRDCSMTTILKEEGYI